VTVDRRLPDRAEVLALVARLEQRDGAPPLSDQALTRLESETVEHFTVDGRGYAQLSGASLEIAAEDDEATEALVSAAEAAGRDKLLVWSHGRRSHIATLLAARGYERTRVLHRLVLSSLAALPPDPPLPDGVTVRPFHIGQDEDGWLRVNAAAFALHREQAQWARVDLVAREREPWFDPDGFLLAERDGELLGFHWTKVHEDGRGEVYVLGVAPAGQGLGLGAALLVRGLRHLADRGCPAALLYVDDDNRSAMRLYEKYGFVPQDGDTQWTKRL
jgi:mycothiol synthase